MSRPLARWSHPFVLPLLAATLLALSLSSAPIAGQQEDPYRPARLGAHPMLLDSALSRPHSVEPGSGPPGTRVTVHMERLPAVSPLWLGIGATRAGFEALTMVLTTPRGDFTQEVEVPAWAGRDRSTAFIVFDPYFRPLALTRPFHVTGVDGSILRQGQLGPRAESCRQMLGEDGVAYALTGDLAAAAPAGREVIVEGTLDPGTACAGTRATIRIGRLYLMSAPR